MQLRAWVAQYALARGVAENTACQLRYSVQRFERWAGRSLVVSDLQDDLFNQWVADEQKVVGRSPATVARDRRNVLTLWRGAYLDRVAEVGPGRIRPCKIPRKVPTAWTPDEMRLILKLVSLLYGRHPNGSKWADWWEALIRTAWDSGLRRGDLFEVRNENYSNDVLVVLQGKTGWPKLSKLRPETQDALTRAGCFERETWFELPYSERYFATYFTRIVQSAGVRKGTFKWIRRASATAAEIARPNGAMQHLGHRTNGLAYIHYVDPVQLGVSSGPPAL